MSWDLRRPARQGSGAPPPSSRDLRRVLSVEDRRVEGKTGPVDLEVVRDVDLQTEATALLVQIPRDFYRMLQETDVDDPDVRRVPLDWRSQTRHVFVSCFERGYRVVDFLRNEGARPANYYLLLRR
jgi:predicted GNAT superfamily acetyltransferase